MNGKKGNTGVIVFQNLIFFLFLNLFFVFVSFKVRSLRHFLDFLGAFPYKSERCKYKYMKYEQRSISLISQKSFFFEIFPHFTVFVCFFESTNVSFLDVLSIQSVDNFLKRNHQRLVWWNSHLICIPISELLSVKVGALLVQESLC